MSSGSHPSDSDLHLAHPRRWPVLATALILLTALTVLVTYPTAFQMRTGVGDVGDPLLNTWALSWVAHQAPIAPARVFDGNIFFPERWTLAYSEPMLVPALMAAPFRWLGAGAVFVYNLVFLSAMVLSGLGTTLLVLELTGHAAASIVAGIVFALLPFRIDHYAHVQLQQTQFIPLTMWALHRVVRTRRVADGARLGVFAACQMLSCVYFGVFLAPYVAVVALVLLAPHIRFASSGSDVMVVCDRDFLRRMAIALGVAALVYAVLVAPVGRAFMHASAVVGERTAGEALIGSATPSDYLATSAANRFYGWTADRFGHAERRLFPGAIAVLLAMLGLWRPWSPAKLAYAVALLVAVDLSFGFNGLSYRILWNVALPFRGLRVPARMGLFAGFSIAVLAGYGVARLSELIRAPWPRRLVTGALAVLMCVEYLSLPFGLTHMPVEQPPIYGDLMRERGDAPRAALLELPLGQDPRYMYYSTFHWQDLLNGYSGFFPPTFFELATAAATFPDERSLDLLRRRGARFVLIHGELMERQEYDRLTAAAAQVPSLKLIARRPWDDREVTLYRLLAGAP